MKRTLSLVLSLILLTTLCGCQSSKHTPANAFFEQNSYECTLTYTIVFDAMIDGEGYAGFKQQFTASGAASLEESLCGYQGTLETFANGALLGSIAVESYGDDAGSYHRYGAVSYIDAGFNSFRSITDLPAGIDFSEYECSDINESLYGSVCKVWYGTEIADNTDQRFVSGLTQGDVSLEGCLANVTLWTDEDTDLPVQLEIDYSNIAELDVTFYDDDGNRFTITELNYLVSYTAYNTPVNIEIPDELRSSANADDALSAQSDAAEVPEELLAHGVISYTGDPSADLSSAYAILNDDSSACYIIDTPEYMLTDEYERDYVCFYYVYDDADIEYISYAFYSYFTGDEEAEYALELPEYIAESDGYSDVTATGLQNVTIDGRTVTYIVIYYTTELDGVAYDTMEVYSWIEAPNGRDCLEVDIVEYNGTGDEIFVDVEEELIYAYEAILGYGKMDG